MRVPHRAGAATRAGAAMSGSRNGQVPALADVVPRWEVGRSGGSDLMQELFLEGFCHPLLAGVVRFPEWVIAADTTAFVARESPGRAMSLGAGIQRYPQFVQLKVTGSAASCPP